MAAIIGGAGPGGQAGGHPAASRGAWSHSSDPRGAPGGLVA
jgi:hypothetical protein